MGEPPAEPRSHRAGAAVLIVALLLALSALAWRGWSTRYVSDDYCTAAGLHEDGYLGNILAHRQEWSGRFSYYAVKGALEAIGPVTARVVPGLMLALTAAAAAWAMRSWLVGLAIAFAAVDSAPEVFSMYGAFVWETGAITYMLPIALLIVWIGMFLRSSSAVASFVLLFIAGGLSETTLAVQAVMTGVGSLFRRRMAIAGFAATLLALAIIATAPGNDVRSRIQPGRGSVVAAAGDALGQAYAFIGVHVFLEGAALFVVLAAGALIGARFSRAAWGRAAAVALLCYVVSFVPSAWAISAAPPPRALYVANFCIVAAVFAAGGALGQSFRPRGLALAVLALLPLWSAYRTVQTIPEAASGAAHVDAIERLLHGRRGQDVVLQSPWALTSHWAGPDPTHSSNRCISRYFGLKSLQVVR